MNEDLRVEACDPEQFWLEASGFLKKDEAMNSLCLGLSYNYRADATDCVYQSILYNNKVPLATLVCSRYHTMRNFLPSPVQNLAHAKKIFSDFQKMNLPITGIIGETKTAQIYKSLFEETGKKIKVLVKQGIYRCTDVILPKYTSAQQIRVAELADADQIAQWIEEFRQEATPEDHPFDTLDMAKNKIKKKMIYLLEANGTTVAMAGWGRDFKTSCTVNLVYTPKKFRKNGYASLLTALLTKYLLQNGKNEINLYTDMANPTSNKIYQNIGYKFVCDSVHLGVV